MSVRIGRWKRKEMTQQMRVRAEVSMGEGKRNNRLELIEKKEFTEGEEVRRTVKREGSRRQKEERNERGCRNIRKANGGGGGSRQIPAAQKQLCLT